MNYVKRHTPNESAALEKFQADQKFVQSIPTEAPEWIYNKSAADLFRRKLINDARLDNGNFLTTQENSPLNAILKTLVPSLNPTRIKVSLSVFNQFPKESPFKAKKFQTCSVAGNGGILKGSGCGEEIDASEFVFRCNMAPMYDEHLTDIGKKTSLITINPTLILYRYHTFANTTSSTKTKYVDAFVRDLSAYGDSYLLIPAFFNAWSVKIAFLTRQVLRDHNARNEVIFPHPDFVRITQSFWRENGLGDKRPSSGLVLLSTAMQICEEVRLYGFWPFHADRNSARLTEHYYDNALPTNAHSVPDEFRQLQRLHNTGVLRLTTTACQRQDNVYD